MPLPDSHLKLATEDDTPRMLELIEEFFNLTVYSKMEFNKEDVLRLVNNVIYAPEEEGSAILLLEGQDDSKNKIIGLLLCAPLHQLFNKSIKLACELIFYIQPEYTNSKNLRLLLSAYRYWAKKSGCNGYVLGKLKNKNDIERYSIKMFKKLKEKESCRV